jgi:quercetin dioxygenase-like cupin family protein
MSISFVHSKGADAPIAIPAIGLDLFVRMAPAASSGAFSIIETVNAPRKGPPRHRHPEAEIFRVLEGRYLYEMDGRRFYAETRDVVSIPGRGNTEVNVTEKPARQYIPIVPAHDAAGLLHGTRRVMRDGVPDKAALDRFGASGGWNPRAAGEPRRPVESVTRRFSATDEAEAISCWRCSRRSPALEPHSRPNRSLTA